MTTTVSAITVQGLVKRFVPRDRGPAALGPLDLDMADGEFVSVVGGSGCGKTTLLRMLAGLIEPSEGSVTCRGERVAGPVQDLGMAFQQAALLDWFSALRNITLQLEVRGIGSKDERNQRGLAMLRSVGLEALAHRKPFELSGGQQQRVALCRSLVHDPSLLLLDEPFGAVDALTRERLQADLENLWMDRHPTVVLVTHSVSEAVFLADRVVVLQGPPGRLVADIAIDLPRPRLPALDAGDPRVAALIRRVRNAVG